MANTPITRAELEAEFSRIWDEALAEKAPEGGDGRWYCVNCDETHPVQPCCGDYANCQRCCVPRYEASRKGLASLVERHVDRVRAEIERDKEVLVFGGPMSPAGVFETQALAAADAILALINASPRTPTREAIAKVVAENMPAVTINRVAWNEESKRLMSLREQAIEEVRKMTGVRGLGGWKAK